jgi:hypothetical protein
MVEQFKAGNRRAIAAGKLFDVVFELRGELIRTISLATEDDEWLVSELRRSLGKLDAALSDVDASKER